MQTCGDDWTMFVNVSRLCEWHTIPRCLTFYRLHAAQSTADTANGLYTLIGYLNAWLAGRGCVDKKRLRDVVDTLSRYGNTYRSTVQAYFWGALRRGDIATAGMIYRAGMLLLPRRRDRLFAMLPPQVTWRWQRYVLGMHK